MTELAPVFKVTALQHMLIGESKRLFQQWKLEGMSFEKLLAKLKDYARGQKLEGDANRGKQAVNLNRVQNWADEDNDPGEGQDEEDGDNLHRVNVKCYVCN